MRDITFDLIRCRISTMDLNEGRKRKADESDPNSALLKRARLDTAAGYEEDADMKLEPPVRR